ncbi:arfaptin-2-like [Scyliorhinus torazame]
MTDGIMGKAATMEIAINSNGDTAGLPEDDSLEQDLQQVMVSGPNLNETSIVSGGYGGTAEAIIATGTIKGKLEEVQLPWKNRAVGSCQEGKSVFNLVPKVRIYKSSTPVIPPSQWGLLISPSRSAASRIASQGNRSPGSTNIHQSQSGPVTSGEEPVRGIAGEKFDIVRKWGINTYKCTKQMISERFGRGSRTVDLELEAQIEVLRDTKRKYENLLRLARAHTNHFYNMVQTQRALGESFSDLSQKSPELQEEFGYNADTQKLLCKNGETLLGAINFFVSSINTLVNKTMEDTLLTIKLFENARLEYDAYRTDLEELNLGPRDSITLPKIDLAQQLYLLHKEKYERLRNDVTIKLKFLEENKVLIGNAVGPAEFFYHFV